jgi:hypothetical protein
MEMFEACPAFLCLSLLKLRPEETAVTDNVRKIYSAVLTFGYLDREIKFRNKCFSVSFKFGAAFATKYLKLSTRMKVAF